MKHYAVPTLITKPKTLIFHVGTNDLHNKTPEDLINAMNDLGETIHRQNNDLELIWSEIITRTDDPNLAEKNIDEEDKDFVITGDFNCNFLSTENNNQHTNKLI
ncbi:Hypothetical predicted protein, partial [Paramuricea clavata]